MEICKEFEFEAAHKLTGVPPDHKCASLHGHSYCVTVTVEGEVDPGTGWVIDFAELGAMVKPLIAQLDHSFLNDIMGLENPTSEVLAMWLWDRLTFVLPGLVCVEASETTSTAAIYRGPS